MTTFVIYAEFLQNPIGVLLKIMTRGSYCHCHPVIKLSTKPCYDSLLTGYSLCHARTILTSFLCFDYSWMWLLEKILLIWQQIWFWFVCPNARGPVRAKMEQYKNMRCRCSSLYIYWTWKGQFSKKNEFWLLQTKPTFQICQILMIVWGKEDVLEFKIIERLTVNPYSKTLKVPWTLIFSLQKSYGKCLNIPW